MTIDPRSQPNSSDPSDPGDPSEGIPSSTGGLGDDWAERSHLSQALEDYLYVSGFVGTCRLGTLGIPPLHPLDPPSTTLDSLIQYWLGLDRRRYVSLPFFVRQAKVNAAYLRELQALDQGLLPQMDPPYTRQSIEDIRNLFALMDAFDRITGIQSRVRRLIKQEVTQRLPGMPL